MISLRQRPRSCCTMLTKDYNTFLMLRCLVLLVVVLCYSPLAVSGDVFAKIAASKTTPPATATTPTPPPARTTTIRPTTMATATPTTTPVTATIAAPTIAPARTPPTTTTPPAVITATPVATTTIAPTAAPNNFGFLPCSICGGDNWSRFIITKPETVIPVDLLNFISAGTTCGDVDKLAINSNLSPPNCQSLVRQQPILSSICGCSLVLLPISTTIRIQWNSVSELLSVGIVPTYNNVLATFLEANLDIAFSFVRSVSLVEQILLLDDNDTTNNTTNSSSSCCLYPLITVINVTIDYDPAVALDNENFTLSNIVPYFTNGIEDVLQRKQNVLINSLQSVDTLYFSNIVSLTATSPTRDDSDDDDDIGSNRTVQPTLRGTTTTMAPTTLDARQPSSFAPAVLPTPPIASPNTDDSSSNRISGGAITGIVIAVLIVLVGLITSFNIYTKSKRRTETIIIMENDFFNGSTINNTIGIPKTVTQLMEEKSNSNSHHSSTNNNNNHIETTTAKSAASSLADMEQSYVAAPIISNNSNNNEVVVTSPQTDSNNIVTSTTSTSSTVSSSSAVVAATAIVIDTNLLTTTKLQEKQLDDDNEEPDIIVDDYNFSKTEESRLVSEDDEGDTNNNMNVISDDKSEESYLMSDDNEDASAASSVEPTADVPAPVPVGFGDATVEEIMANIVETSGSSSGSSFVAPKRIRPTPWDDIKESKEDAATTTEPVVETASTRDGATAALALAATKATTTTKSKAGGNASSSSSSLFAAFSSASYLHVDPKTMSRRTIVAPSGKLGIVIDTTLEGPVIHKVKADSPLQGLLYPGDIIINVDGIDTRAMSAGAITALMIKTANHERNMTILYNAKE